MLILQRLAQVTNPSHVRSEPRVRLATEYIHANLDKELSLHDLSRVSGLSPSHFVRVFKATTSVSPHRYLMRARLEASRDLLARSDSAISTIALASGFSSQSHFTSAFGQYFAMTPAAFRRSVLPDRPLPLNKSVRGEDAHNQFESRAPSLLHKE